MTKPSFRETPLWEKAFESPRDDAASAEQQFFKDAYLSVRDAVSNLTPYISADMREYTVHDISHFDALWDMASLVSEGVVNLNPPEAYVFGCSTLLHDAGMTLAAYPNGVADLKQTVAWKDATEWVKSKQESRDAHNIDTNNLSDDVAAEVIPLVLRELHPERAETLACQAWTSNGSPQYLIADDELRKFYGPIIGEIAHSHCLSLQEVGDRLDKRWGALPNRTKNTIDCLMVACFLRIADILHLDSRRAPRLRRAIIRPTGVSSLHWTFQERLARPHIENGSVVFSTGEPFELDHSDAWWLAFETLRLVDSELRGVNALLLHSRHISLNARDVKGIASPKTLSTSLRTKGWTPVDLLLKASDVPGIVNSLGGKRLYGRNPTVVLRELIQNAADAVEARRKLESRPEDWGEITIALTTKGANHWLEVEDNGTGMSEFVLSNILLDFGKSLWGSSSVMSEYPGLLASGYRSRGQFGIGFYSVFMIGSLVRIYTRRYDKSYESGRCLEFRSATETRPILYPVKPKDLPVDGGTRVQIRLRDHPDSPAGLLNGIEYSDSSVALTDIVGMISPALNVRVEVGSAQNKTTVVTPRDWINVRSENLIRRLNPVSTIVSHKYSREDLELMRPIESGDGVIYGRGFIYPSSEFDFHDRGYVVISGLRANRMRNIEGVLLGEVLTLKRDEAEPIVPPEALERWASEQGRLTQEMCAKDNRQEFRLREARVAEIVLECGGDVGNLKIVRWGREWLDCRELDQKILEAEEIVVAVDTQFEWLLERGGPYVELLDDSFRQSNDVCFIAFQYGKVLAGWGGRICWPTVMAGEKKMKGTNVLGLVARRIETIWESVPEITSSTRVVGVLGDIPIEVEVCVFRLPSGSDEGK